MRIHHLNCTSMCPLGGFLMDGHSPLIGRAELVCHCLLIETDRDGLVLVDTGFGLNDVHEPDARLSRWFKTLLRPQLDELDTAVRQVERLGYAASDVRHVVLTHLDFDHAGGLDDFPEARVHLLADERAIASAQRTWLDRNRFRPAQWRSEPRWTPYTESGEPWFGFACVRGLRGLPPELLMVPLAGHTVGHAGVAVEHQGRWLLHCGDAYFYHEEMNPWGHRCPPGMRLYQRLMEQNREQRLSNQHRLRQLVRYHREEVRLFCAHDKLELERLQAETPLAVVRDRVPTIGPATRAPGRSAVPKPPH